MMLTESTLESTSWKTIFDLINTNKPAGWTVVSRFNEGISSFPCMVVHPLRAIPINLSASKTRREYEIKSTIEFFATIGQRKEKIDEGRSNVRETILANLGKRSNGLVWKEFVNGDFEDVEIIDEETQLNTDKVITIYRGN